MAKRESFTKPRFALCEGNEDAALVRGLIATKSRHISPFDVSPVNDLAEGAKGNSGFEIAAIGADGISGFEGISDIVVISDNDDDPTASFANVRAQLERAKMEGNLQYDWAIPTEPAIALSGAPSVSIWMWPEAGQPGCLETVLWRIVEQKYQQEAACVDAALACAQADQWPISKRDKARIRCFISLRHRKNPALPLSLVWRDAPAIFPLSNAAFNPIAHFLAAL
jgi:Protein of unknown function (DUF3226)